MITNISSLRRAIDTTLRAIEESQEQVETITRTTMEEVERLEREYEELKVECLDAIANVERLEQASKFARERLLRVNRDVGKSTEQEMRQAYESAQKLQGEVSQWREREVQLRLRRDEVARRLKSLRATAREAEILMIKLQQVTAFLGQEVENVTDVVEGAETQSLLGVRLLQIQEEERRMLAQRLHDGAMQSLASVAMRIQSPEVDSISFRDDMRSSLNDVITDLRQVVFDLRPPLLDDLGLVPTLKRYAEEWTKTTGIIVHTELIGLETTLTPTEKVTVFRTVQEGLRNIAQHSEATRVNLTLKYRAKSLEIHLVDNGLGIHSVDWQSFAESGRTGLLLAKQRLGALGGTLDIMPGESGVKLLVTIPVTGGQSFES